MVCASVLHVFNISPAVDADGKSIPLEAKFTKDSVTS